jgi:hypothetical protein
MTLAQPRQRLTAADFEAFADHPDNIERRLELIDGEIVEKMATEQHAEIAANITFRLKLYQEATNNGSTAVEARYRKPDDDHNALIPDVSYRLGDRRLLQLVASLLCLISLLKSNPLTTTTVIYNAKRNSICRWVCGWCGWSILKSGW